ncbi:MAG: addiction module protein [Prosthecobacter sp.]|nr:addiction module protein [Prosthecobacter sp.]
MILETIPAIHSLTVDQKLRLVWEIWNDVSKDTHLSQQTSSLLEERLAEYETHPNAVRTTDEVTAGILKLKKRLASGQS